MIMKLVIFWLVVFNFTVVASAQSGRKTTPPPTLNVEVRQDSDYSESAPNKPRSIYISPISRVKKEKKSKNEAKSQTQAPTAPQIVDANTDDGDVVKIETNLITIPVSVYDRNGLYISNLRQTDFKIFENGEEQEIAYFGTSEKPFTVILLIDTSPSTAYKIEEIQSAATAFVNQLKPQDNVMVIEFDANVHVLTETTNDRQKIFKAIGKADFGDGTSLYDAVDFSLRKRLGKIEGRKAIVLFTDGVDTASYKNDFDSTIRDAEESEALIFPIYYNTFFDNRGGGTSSTIPNLGGILSGRGNTSGEYALGRKYLEELSAATGGRIFRPEATPGGLTAAFEGIAEELRRQYNIGYYPQTEAKTGQRKQIKVRINRPNVVVRARDSYIVGANNQSPTAK